MEQQTSKELINDIMREIYTFESFAVAYTEQEFKLLEDNIREMLEGYFNDKKR
jgi:hypothetical protein